MKVAILAGGRGTRLSEETELRPKPMVEIGGRPMLWHIMKYYESFGFNDFVYALGYKGDIIKRWMLDSATLTSGDISIDFKDGAIFHHDVVPDARTVRLIETGLGTQTGGRIKRLEPHLGGETFMLTWGDGVADVNLDKLLAFHRSHGKLATLTAVRPPARFGHVELNGDRVKAFTEKPSDGDGRWINGAFFVLEPGIFDYIEGDQTIWEREPLVNLARDGQLMAYQHDGFWQCMDTIRDRELLEELWEQGAPWKVWADA